MKDYVIILDNGHGKETKGKCSPDHRIYEWKYTREIVKKLYEKLEKNGIETKILVPEDTDIRLSERVKREKMITTEAIKNGKKVLLVSVHLNAAGNGDKWMSASGWQVHVGDNASQASKAFAKMIYSEAESYGLKGNRSVPKEKYWVSPFYILRHTSCPAVLTENMFQDNKKDTEFLLSEEGKNTIIDLHFNAIKKFISE